MQQRTTFVEMSSTSSRVPLVIVPCSEGARLPKLERGFPATTQVFPRREIPVECERSWCVAVTWQPRVVPVTERWATWPGPLVDGVEWNPSSIPREHRCR